MKKVIFTIFTPGGACCDFIVIEEELHVICLVDINTPVGKLIFAKPDASTAFDYFIGDRIQVTRNIVGRKVSSASQGFDSSQTSEKAVAADT